MKKKDVIISIRKIKAKSGFLNDDNLYNDLDSEIKNLIEQMPDSVKFEADNGVIEITIDPEINEG